MSEEIWKNVNGIATRYAVSNFGRIKSFDFTDRLGRTRKGRMLKLHMDKRGYPRVSLSNGYKNEHWRIHRLVAIHFIPNPNNLPQVNHKDANKQNNTIENLEWATNKDNSIHGHKLGLFKYHEGEKHANFISPIKVYQNSKLIAILKGNKDMKRQGFDFRLVSACLHGKRHTHRNCTFVRE